MVEAKRKDRLATVATWALTLMLGWLLYRLAVVLIRDFWVIAIAWMQP